MTRETPRARVEPGKSQTFQGMGEQFVKAEGLARNTEYWNAAGLLLVHAAIAYADAICIRLAGMKSTSDKHTDVVHLLREAAANEKDLDRALGHFTKILDEKNRVAYTGETFRKQEIEALESHAERFKAWAEGVLKRSEA